MSALVWWLLPATATTGAVIWAAWVRRPPRPVGDAESVAAYARFRATLARSAPLGNTDRPPHV